MTGKDIIVILSQNGTAIASTRIKSNRVQSKCETIEKASATQQTWTESIAGRASWLLTTDYLVLAPGQMQDLLRVRQLFDVTITATEGQSSTALSGKAILKEVTINAAVGALAKGNFVLEGTGPLT